MHPVLSIGAYLIAQTITFWVAVWCTRHAGGPLLRGAAGKVLFVSFLVIYIALLILPVLGAMLPDSRLKFDLQAAGNIWLGFDVYFSGLLLVLCLVCGIGHQLAARGRRAACAVPVLLISVIAALVLMIYGMIHAQHTVQKEYDVTIEKDAGALEELKVVLIADLHMSVNSQLSMIRSMVDQINTLGADVILIAGDIFSSSYEGLKDPDSYSAVLREMKSTYGTFAVYGNHDVEETLFGGFPISPISKAFRTKQMEQFFEDCAFQVLYDEVVTIADGAVQIAGRVDGEKAGDGTANRESPQQLLRDIDPAKPVIVLEHEPVEFAPLGENGADLVLCGHTHAGQIFPGNLVVPFFNENGYGYKELGGVDTIVTSGIGYYGPPMRVGTNSEITIVNVHFEKAGNAS